MTFRRMLTWLFLLGLPLAAWFIWPTPFEYVEADPAVSSPEVRIRRVTGEVEAKSPEGVWHPYQLNPNEPTRSALLPGGANTAGHMDVLKKQTDEVRQMKETTDKAVEAELRRARGE